MAAPEALPVERFYPMCDTLVALNNSTADGSVLFAKNSDREPNEAHHLLLVQAAEHEPGEMLKCTYTAIPQVPHTNAVLLAKPFWIWGAEMGANEHGVAIGNEAVFSKIAASKEPGLIGMDFIRLGLERAATAREALYVMTSLLEAHGQGGNCGFDHPFYYHNSFIIADPREAWVLETVDKQWAAEQVRDVRSISNLYTIHKEWDLASSGVVDYVLERELCKDRQNFDFSACYSDFLYTRFGAGASRRGRITDELSARKGSLTVENMISLLSSHSHSIERGFAPDKGLLGADVCMHAGFGPVRGSQSIGSMVSHLSAGEQTHWLTGTSAPCTSVFKPVWIDAGLPDTGPTPAGEYDQRSLFWRHELLHREILRNYPARWPLIAGEREELQRRFLESAGQLACAPVKERRAFSEQCFREADEAEARWLKRVRAEGSPPRQTLYGARAWSGFNKKAKIS